MPQGSNLWPLPFLVFNQWSPIYFHVRILGISAYYIINIRKIPYCLQLLRDSPDNVNWTPIPSGISINRLKLYLLIYMHYWNVKLQILFICLVLSEEYSGCLESFRLHLTQRPDFVIELLTLANIRMNYEIVCKQTWRMFVNKHILSLHNNIYFHFII